MVYPEEELTGYEIRSRQRTEEANTRQQQPPGNIPAGSLDQIVAGMDQQAAAAQPEQVAAGSAPAVATSPVATAGQRTGPMDAAQAKKFTEVGDVFSAIEANQAQRDEQRRKRLQRIANAEAIGNALAAIGGIASARRGGPVFAIDRTQANQAIGNMAAEEAEWLGQKRQGELLMLQETINQINSEKKRQEALEMMRENYKNKGIEAEQAFEKAVELEDIRHKNDMEQEKARIQAQKDINAANNQTRKDLAYISGSQRTQAIERTANANYNRVNPVAVELVGSSSSGGGRVVIGGLRNIQRDTFYTELMRNPQVVSALQSSTNMFARMAVRNPDNVSEDVKNKIVQDYWTLMPDLANTLMQQQEAQRNGLIEVEQSRFDGVGPYNQSGSDDDPGGIF